MRKMAEWPWPQIRPGVPGSDGFPRSPRLYDKHGLQLPVTSARCETSPGRRKPRLPGGVAVSHGSAVPSSPRGQRLPLTRDRPVRPVGLASHILLAWEPRP